MYATLRPYGSLSPYGSLPAIRSEPPAPPAARRVLPLAARRAVRVGARRVEPDLAEVRGSPPATPDA